MNAILLMTIVVTGALAQCAWGASLRVVGGELAEKGQFPYHVALTRQGKLHCGGVLVHEKFVLTAAHCFFQGGKPVPEKSLRVYFGSERLMMGGQFRRVQAVHLHENYDHEHHKYDLAVVEINKPIEFSETVHGVNVGETAFTENGEVTFTGWGRTAEDENTTYKLKYTTLNSLPAEKCQEELGEAYYEGALCFHDHEEHSGVCFGDYGGPAVHEDTLVGVASYTAGGVCGSDKPDVFVDVGAFHDWVQEKIGASNETH